MLFSVYNFSHLENSRKTTYFPQRWSLLLLLLSYKPQKRIVFACKMLDFRAQLTRVYFSSHPGTRRMVPCPFYIPSLMFIIQLCLHVCCLMVTGWLLLVARQNSRQKGGKCSTLKSKFQTSKGGRDGTYISEAKMFPEICSRFLLAFHYQIFGHHATQVYKGI